MLFTHLVEIGGLSWDWDVMSFYLLYSPDEAIKRSGRCALAIYVNEEKKTPEFNYT